MEKSSKDSFGYESLNVQQTPTIFGIKRPVIDENLLLVLTSVYFIVFTNYSFFEQLFSVYPVSETSSLELFSVALVLLCATTLLLAILCWKKITKPLLIVLFFSSAMASYFMNNYHIIIDTQMIDNIFKTDTAEASDLISTNMFAYIFFLGLIPSLLILAIRIKGEPAKKYLIKRFTLISSSILISFICIISFSDFFTIFIREHKQVRLYANPGYFMVSVLNYGKQNISPNNEELTTIGNDAHISETDEGHELVILVLGETARADHFSLNGYERETNPLLSKEDVISLTQVSSCGTSTAYSVPCIFAQAAKNDFSESKASHTENALDILTHAGVKVLWLDNNSSSKGVADRVEYHNYKNPELNPVCDSECRDIGMLSHLPKFIKQNEHNDMLIVLHQMGNHGPAYYKRYPESFKYFTPECLTNELANCEQQSVINAYDNAIRYTDYFLSETIAFLKNYDTGHYEVTLIYVSDHGESLGENHLYLHGLPYALAPEAQTHVPAVIWFGKSMLHEINVEKLKQEKDMEFSHDNIFHTLLGLFEVGTDVYNPEIDLLEHFPEHEHEYALEDE